MKKSSEIQVRQVVAGILSAALFMTGASALALAQTQNFNQTDTTQSAPQANPQQDPAPTGQQLPDGFAQQQLPNSFSMGDEPAQIPASDQIIPQATDAASADGEVVQQLAQIPAEPEQKRLVPSTPMGAAAQSVGNQQSTGNPVEDAAAAADREIAAQQAAQQDELPADILDQYAQQSADGDALPEVNNATMLRMEGDFPNANRNVTVGIDGGAEPSPEERKILQEGIRQDAFDAAITGMFPLSPDQIKTLLGRYDRTQEAVETPPYDSPKPEINVTNISLDPGVLPPSIKTAVGNVTTLNILDATGAPWPVQDVTWAGDFEIVEPEEGGHIIRITPVAQHARGNIVIRLLTLKTPLTMTLETSRDIVQYRVDARVPEYGPFAQAPLMQGGKSMVAGDSTLTTLLDGVAPSGAMKLTVSGVDGRTTAYAKGGQTYVRTPLTLLSPAWQSSVTSADGMNVYVMSSAPVLLLSDEGEFMRASLVEKEDLLDE